MRISVFLGLVMALSVPSVSAKSQGNVRASVPLACELHFWPASSVNTYPRAARAKGGLVWALALGGQKRAEGFQAIRSDIASYLDASGSILALGKDKVPNRLGQQHATLIIHDKPLDEHGLYRTRTRREASNSPCYSELIVTGLLYRNGSFGGRFLDSSFMLREFGSAREPIRVTTGGGSIKLTKYPAKEGEDTDAASADLSSAFRQGFESFVTRVGTIR